MKKFKNFIEIDSTEEEKIEQIKHWLKENLLYIVLGIGLGTGGLFSWDYYQSYQDNQAQTARNLYLEISQSNDLAKNQQTYQTLKKQYSDGIYVHHAELMLAKYASQNKDFDQASRYLEPLLENDNRLISQMARLHLAEILIEQNQLLKAIALLSVQAKKLENLGEDSYFQALKYNLLGDIYLLQNKKALARQQYERATKLPGVNISDLGKILKIKKENLR